LYTPLPIRLKPWDNVSIDFVVALPRTQREKAAVTVAKGKFSKVAHFVPCHKTDDASYIAEIYLKEIIRLHGVPETIVYNRYSKLLSHF